MIPTLTGSLCFHLRKNLGGELEKVRTVKWRSYFGVRFVVVSHREPERVCHTSQSFVVRLLNRLRSVWSVQQREMRNRVWQSAVTSDDHWDFWSLDRSNETALCLIKSLLSVLLLPVSVFIAPSFNPLLLSVSQFICRVRCCLSSAVDSLSLYVVRFFYFVRFVPWKPGSSCITAVLPPRGGDAWKVGWPARGRVALLSDAGAREWSKSRISGVADRSQTCVCLNPPQNEEPSSSLLFFKAE